MIGHSLFNFVFATVGMVVILYAVYFYLKQTMQLGGPGRATPQKGKGLRIESILPLEPRKRLYVVRSGQQRFLIATTMDKTELLTTLEAEPQDAVAEESTETTTALPGAMSSDCPFDPQGGFMERFRYSLKTVVFDRFMRVGGK